MRLAQWVLSNESAMVPRKIEMRLIKVKYLTSLNGLTFSGDDKWFNGFIGVV